MGTAFKGWGRGVEESTEREKSEGVTEETFQSKGTRDLDHRLVGLRVEAGSIMVRLKVGFHWPTIMALKTPSLLDLSGIP